MITLLKPPLYYGNYLPVSSIMETAYQIICVAKNVPKPGHRIETGWPDPRPGHRSRSSYCESSWNFLAASSAFIFMSFLLYERLRICQPFASSGHFSLYCSPCTSASSYISHW